MSDIPQPQPDRNELGQIQLNSPVVNFNIIAQGRNTMQELAQKEDPVSQKVSEIYNDLDANSPNGYATYADVACALNQELGTEWIEEGHIWKLARTVHHDEREYRLADAIYASEFLNEIFSNSHRNIISFIALPENENLITDGNENHEAAQARNIARLTFLYRGNQDLRQFFFESTARTLQSCYDTSTRYDSKKIYKQHLESIGGKIGQDYAFDQEHAEFPTSLFSSKKLMNQITQEALFAIRDRDDLLQSVSELDIVLATGALHGVDTSEIYEKMMAMIEDSYSNEFLGPVASESVANSNAIQIHPQSYTLGRWMSWLTGAEMKPTKLK